MVFFDTAAGSGRRSFGLIGQFRQGEGVEFTGVRAGRVGRAITPFDRFLLNAQYGAGLEDIDDLVGGFVDHDGGGEVTSCRR